MQRGSALRFTGIALILLSGVCFFSMLSLPLWTLSTTNKGILGGALFVGVQGFWWVGAALLGPTAFDAIRRRFGKTRSEAQGDVDDEDPNAIEQSPRTDDEA
ncbi:MAG: hypothetical protein AAGG48_10645 [Planctomycetota bacterium]